MAPLPHHHVPRQPYTSDSEDDTVCAQSPASASYMIRPVQSRYTGPAVFEMDLDEPSTVTEMEDDADEETTVDETSEIYEESASDELDTTIDYSYLRGAIESPLGLEAFPGTSLLIP